MNRSDCKALRSAAYELEFWSHHITGLEPPALRLKAKHAQLVRRLRDIAKREQSKLPPKGAHLTDCDMK